jgi:predicted phage terminase large subunit-like protein
MIKRPTSAPPHGLFAAALRNDFLTFAGKSIMELDRHPLTVLPHVTLMAAELLGLYQRTTTQLIVNLPPRLLKSRLCTVCFAAWTVGKRPGQRVLVVSHDQKLADSLVDDIRTLVRAPWYEQAFAGAGESPDMSRSGHFKSQNGGEVMARSMDAGVTGHGFDLIVFDDPMDAGDANSAAARDRAIDLYEGKFRSRLQSQRDSAMMIVAQRLHRDDLCGHLETQPGWRRLVIPLVATSATEHRVGETVWQRPAGNNLDPDRYPAEWVEVQERQNPSVFASQYQQAPFLTESAILKRQWILTYSGRPPADAHRITISVDCAASQKAGSSYTCMLVWATDGADHYLIEVVRDRLLFPDISDRLFSLIQKFRPQTVLIEDASVGAALIPHIKKLLPEKGLPTAVKAVKPILSKADRLRQHVDVFANGRIRVPEGRPSSEVYVDELMLFEEAGYSDQVDATTQYLDYAKERMGLAFTPVILGAGGSHNPPTPGNLSPRPVDQSTLRRPAHGEPSIRDPKAPRGKGFSGGRGMPRGFRR